jgi:hypothetical protein
MEQKVSLSSSSVEKNSQLETGLFESGRLFLNSGLWAVGVLSCAKILDFAVPSNATNHRELTLESNFMQIPILS